MMKIKAILTLIVLLLSAAATSIQAQVPQKRLAAMAFADDGHSAMEVFKYDTSNRLVSINQPKSTTVIDWSNYDKGEVVMMHTTEKSTWQTIYTLDKEGRAIKSQAKYSENYSSVCEYLYDKNGHIRLIKSSRIFDYPSLEKETSNHEAKFMYLDGALTTISTNAEDSPLEASISFKNGSTENVGMLNFNFFTYGINLTKAHDLNAALAGLLGKPTNKLPDSIYLYETDADDPDELNVSYKYEFDKDGYPTSIKYSGEELGNISIALVWE